MTTFDFSNVAAREPQAARVSSIVLTELRPSYAASDVRQEDPLYPTLFGRYAGEKNKPLRAAILKANAKRAGPRGALSEEDRGKIAIANVRALWPLHVFTGWEHVVQTDGTVVPFSPEAAEALLAKLPDWILTRVILHFSDPLNFVDDPADAVTQKEVEATAGN